MPLHAAYTGDNLHVPGYVQESDPGAVGAGRDWFQPSTRRLRRRNTGNSAWLDVATFPPVRTVAASAHTLEVVDVGAHLRLDDFSGGTLTVPHDASLSLPVGTTVGLETVDGPWVVLPEDSAPLIWSRDSLVVIPGGRNFAQLRKVDVNEWLLWGDLSA